MLIFFFWSGVHQCMLIFKPLISENDVLTFGKFKLNWINDESFNDFFLYCWHEREIYCFIILVQLSVLIFPGEFIHNKKKKIPGVWQRLTKFINSYSIVELKTNNRKDNCFFFKKKRLNLNRFLLILVVGI